MLKTRFSFLASRRDLKNQHHFRDYCHSLTLKEQTKEGHRSTVMMTTKAKSTNEGFTFKRPRFYMNQFKLQQF